MSKKRKELWVILAHFLTGNGDRWLDDFISDPQIEFEKITPPNISKSWHVRKSKLTSQREWIGHLHHTLRAVSKNPTGIVACFPQLAMCAALIKKLTRRKFNIIAYNFNLGALHSGKRQAAARFVAGQIDFFIVHSPAEVKRYASYLAVPEEKVKFIPLQRGVFSFDRNEEFNDPYLISMGSAGRDYQTLVSAVNDLGIKTIIISRPDMIKDLKPGPNVYFKSSLSYDECMKLLSGARISVTPISNQETASGQITFLNAMQMGVPIIATRCPGTEGYIEDGKNGLLVAPANVEDMKKNILSLWEDEKRRQDISSWQKEKFFNSFSDEAAAKSLENIINLIRVQTHCFSQPEQNG